MKNKISDLPKFVRDTPKETIVKNSKLIKEIFSLLTTIVDAVRTKERSIPEEPIPVISIIARLKKSSNAVKQIVDKLEDKMTLEIYLATIKDIAEEIHAAVVANHEAFYNKVLLKHYQDTTNTLLLNAYSMIVINYCLGILNETKS